MGERRGEGQRPASLPAPATLLSDFGDLERVCAEARAPSVPCPFDGWQIPAPFHTTTPRDQNSESSSIVRGMDPIYEGSESRANLCR